MWMSIHSLCSGARIALAHFRHCSRKLIPSLARATQVQTALESRLSACIKGPPFPKRLACSALAVRCLISHLIGQPHCPANDCSLAEALSGQFTFLRRPEGSMYSQIKGVREGPFAASRRIEGRFCGAAGILIAQRWLAGVTSGSAGGRGAFVEGVWVLVSLGVRGRGRLGACHFCGCFVLGSGMRVLVRVAIMCSRLLSSRRMMAVCNTRVGRVSVIFSETCSSSFFVNVSAVR
jgi:hypothetical protein